MRPILIGVLATVGFLAMPAHSDLFSSVRLDGRVDSNPLDSTENVSVTGSCSAANTCSLFLSSPPVTGLAFADAYAHYGYISESLNVQMYAGPFEHSGSVSYDLSTRATDTFILLGGLDYGYVQVTVSGIAEAYEIGAPPTPNLRFAGTDIPLPVDFFFDSTNDYSLTTPLLALPGTQFDLGLTSGAHGGTAFAYPMQLFDMFAQIDSIQFLDSNQNPLDKVYYFDESGTAYPIAGGVQLFSPSAEVPEPWSIALLITVLGALSYGWKRKQ